MIWIKKVYLYLVSMVSLIILIIASIMLINMALKTWVFPKADTNYYYEPQVACEAPTTDKDGSPINSFADPCLNNQFDAMQQETERSTAQKQRDAAQALAMIIVATPVFLYHWRLARKEV